MLGNRLKLARTAAGLSLRDLEAKINRAVSAQAIGMYERDETTPRSDVLITLADALQISVSWLSSAEQLTLDRVDFRKRKLTSPKDEAAVRASVSECLERYLEVEDVLGLDSRWWRQPKAPQYKIKTSIDDVEAAAEKLRQEWGLGLDPLPSLGEFLEEEGIKVLCIELPEKISGMSCTATQKTSNGSFHAIVVNSVHPGERQRFTLCHELGHLILSVSENFDEEKVADRFAGAFLMPRETIEKEVGTRRKQLSLGELLSLKKVFGASAAAVLYRCKQLEVISEDFYKQTYSVFARRGWTRAPYEPEPVNEEPSRRFERLCFRGVAEGVMSHAKAAELLGKTVEDFIQGMDVIDTLANSEA